MIKPVRAVRCPTCGKEVEWKTENRFRPFCSERCKQIDLGAWASETYRVPTAPPDAELPQSDDVPPKSR
ncbi:MAG: DNA gyrase inhibitor YacG [Proteobacteria bacterium]|nr:DNA gyrase inhibitor YacG [Pseudomonadota bacterium]